MAVKKGLKINEYGIFREKTTKNSEAKTRTISTTYSGFNTSRLK